MQILVSAHCINIRDSMVYRTQSRKPSLRLSMGISDEIEDTKIAIDETKISEIEATKRRIVSSMVLTEVMKQVLFFIPWKELPKFEGIEKGV